MDALASIPKEATPVFLVMHTHIDPIGRVALLALDGVAGLVVTPETASTRVGDARIGVMTDNGEWTLPTTTAHSLLLLQDLGTVGARRARIAMRVGVTALVHKDACAIWRVLPLRYWILHKWQERINAVMTRYTPSGVRDRILSRRLAAHVRRFIGNRPSYFVPARILLVGSSLAAGGAERQLVNTVLPMVEAGYDVALLCDHLGTEATDFFLPLVMSHLPVRRVRDLLEIRFAESPEVMKAIQAQIEKSGMVELSGILPQIIDDVASYAAEFLLHRPSVVHLWQDHNNVIGGLAAFLVGVPRIVLGMRNLAPCHFAYFQPYMAPIYRVLAQQSNVVMVNNSAAGAADYADWLAIDPDRIRVLHNGIIDEGLGEPAVPAEVAAWRLQIGLPSEALVIGGILRFAPEKNPLLWIKTAAAVAKIRPDVHFLLIGDGPMRAEIVQHAEALGISDRLHMPGTVKDIRLPIAAMEVFFLSSRQEGLPNVLLEAQMLGCPVVTTDAGGSAETVDHGRTGWVVSTHDPQSLAERLLQVLGDAEWRRQAGVAAGAFIRSRFGMERMVAETLRVYGM